MFTSWIYYRKMKRYVIVLMMFLFSRVVQSQNTITPYSYIETHLGEPFYLSYSHPLISTPNLRFNVGLGGLGLFYATDYQKRYGSHNSLYSGRSRIYVMNTSVRYSLPVLFKSKVGWIVQTAF